MLINEKNWNHKTGYNGIDIGLNNYKDINILYKKYKYFNNKILD
jgi:hypothetical protein